MSTFMRTNSASSLSSISSFGSDNADATSRVGKNGYPDADRKAKNIMQRTRDALGDIGNRLKKNPSNLGGKALAPSNAILKKPTVGTSDFVAPTGRPPRALAKPKQKTIEKSKSTVSSGVKKEVGLSNAKTATTQSLKSEVTQVIESENAVQIKTESIPAEVVESDKENVASAEVEAKEEVENEYNPKLEIEPPVKAFSADKLGIVDIDVGDPNPLLVQGYIQEIYDYVFAQEKKYPIRIRYLEGRSVNSRMRGVLLDWLIEVHTQFGFMPETLYLASKILDRYLQADRSITRKQLQLVGVTAMYLAAKYEEVCTPAVQDFAAVSDNAFTVADVIKMEQDMLNVMKFDLGFPPAVLFLRRFSKAANATMSIHSMAKYIMELSLVDYGACHLYPSEQAAGALALSLVILEHKSLAEVWTPTLQHYSKYPLEAIKPLVSTLAGVLSRAHDETNKLKAVSKKYTAKRLSHTSLAPELKDGSWKQRVLKDTCKA